MWWQHLAWMDRIGPDQGFLSSLPSTANVLSQSGSELDSREAKSIISNGAEHMTVWLQELLCDHRVNYPDSLWLGSFRLSASLCVRSGARAGQGPLAVPCPELRACRFPSLLTVAGSGHVYFSLHILRWFLCDGDEHCKWFHTTHEMLTGLSEPLIDWPSFIARRGLLIGIQLPADTVTLMEENYCCLVMH